MIFSYLKIYFLFVFLANYTDDNPLQAFGSSLEATKTHLRENLTKMTGWFVCLVLNYMFSFSGLGKDTIDDMLKFCEVEL